MNPADQHAQTERLVLLGHDEPDRLRAEIDRVCHTREEAVEQAFALGLAAGMLLDVLAQLPGMSRETAQSIFRNTGTLVRLDSELPPDEGPEQ